MKRFEIAISGSQEEEIGMEILTAVYAAIQGRGYHDVSIQAQTVPDKGKPRGFCVPDFMGRQGRITERGR